MNQLSRSDLIGWMLSSGGADLWRTRQGKLWEPVTTNGFDNFYSAELEHCLEWRKPFVGTANPLGRKYGILSYDYEPLHLRCWYYDLNTMC